MSMLLHRFYFVYATSPVLFFYGTSPVLFCLCYITGSILADLAEAPVPVQSFSQRAAGRQPCDVSHYHHGAGQRCGGRQREPTGEGPNQERLCMYVITLSMHVMILCIGHLILRIYASSFCGHTDSLQTTQQQKC